MPVLPGPRVLLSNSEDDRVQPIPAHYVERELAVMRMPADRTGFTLTVATAGTTLPLLKASGISSTAIGAITVAPTTGLFAIKKRGVYRVRFEGKVNGTASKFSQISVLKNGTEEADSLRQWANAATPLFGDRVLDYVLTCAPGDTLALGCDVETNGNALIFDGFSLTVELLSSHE
jgi:hypothetical protein